MITTLSFENVLLKVINESLIEVFGCIATQAIFNLLDNKYALKKGDIAKKPEVFQKMLEEMFGAGGKALEDIIIKKLYEQLNVEIERFSLNQHVKYLKINLGSWADLFKE